MTNAIESKITAVPAPATPISRSFGLPSLKWAEQYDRQRERVEQFISGVFQAGFQAKIMTYAPHLLYLESERRIQASLGLRHAAGCAQRSGLRMRSAPLPSLSDQTRYFPGTAAG